MICSFPRNPQEKETEKNPRFHPRQSEEKQQKSGYRRAKIKQNKGTTTTLSIS
jgi:hypothetical protein